MSAQIIKPETQSALLKVFGRNKQDYLAVSVLSMFVGTVKITDGSNFIIENSGGVLKSKKALSCLIEPVPGDKVLFYEDAGGQSYVLSVLERTDTRPAMVHFENGACIKDVFR